VLLFKQLSLLILFSQHVILNKCYLFSVIMAIYNTGRYLDDSISSLINQTINFKKNIQIILVNDGSIDNSEEICLKYQNIYFKNIKYIKIEHSGVSKARNIGLNYAKGRYINFLDPDDIWHHKAFYQVFLFFKIHKYIDLVAGRLKFFEASEKYHPLDYKFYKTRVVNLSEEYQSIQLSASSAFFRFSIIKGKKFDEKVFSGEDTIFVNNLLIKKPIFGLIREVLYFYRRRADSSSTVQTQKFNINFYFKTIEQVEKYLINKSLTLHNKILPFIQFFVGYDILFRIKSNAFLQLDNNNVYAYYLLLEEMLKIIEDKYILEQKNLPNIYKMIALSKKYNKDIRNDIIIYNDSFFYLNYKMIDIKQNNIISWRIIDIKNNILYLEGRDNFWIQKENYYYYCRLDNNTFYPKYYEYPNYDLITIYGIIKKGRIVHFEIPLNLQNNSQIISFHISYNNFNRELRTSLGWFSHLPSISNGYYVSDNYILKYIENRFVIYDYNKNLVTYFEKLYCRELQKLKKSFLIKLRKRAIKSKNIKKNKNKSEIWLVNDRRDQAGDNGEYFFRYLIKKQPEHINIYFVIEKNCSDYHRLKKLGNILDLNSQKYLNIFLIADKIISSISNSWVINPFKEDYAYMKDLIKFDNIFLQHGIIKDDLSNYLNRYSKKYDIFEKIKKNINIKKQIIIIPTWRFNIKGTIDLITYKSIYSETFTSTNYFHFYNKLINDQKLLLFMDKYNYKGIFCLHPCFSAQWVDFQQNNYFLIEEKCNYQEFLLESSLLITDYSSIFFDFGYLRKPVIYSHFDYEKYRKSHYREGYFDYKYDGFGPVCFNINCTINEIIYEIKNNCFLRVKYLKRIKKFFSFLDQNNCERVFNEIIKKKKNIKSINKYIIIIILINFFKIVYMINNN